MSRKTKQQTTQQDPQTQQQTPAPEATSNEPSAKGLPCLCGCGLPTQTDAARFLSGHDARLRKTVIEAGLAWSAVPEAARPFFLFDRSQDEATAGLWIDNPESPRWLRDAKADRKRKAADDEIERRVAERLAQLAAEKEAAVA